jgi:Ribonuclease HI
MKLLIFTDGASRGNPGKSASGYAIYNDKYELLAESSIYNGIATNNEAEYKAIIEALKAALEKFGKDNDIELYSDSKLVISQLKGAYKVKSKKMKALNEKASTLLKSFSSYSLNNPRRSNVYISKVDKQINKFLDSLENQIEKEK